MSDYGYAQRSAEEMVNAALNKGAELTQAILSQISKALEERLPTQQSRSPQAHMSLFHSFYEAYQNHGVEPEIAQAAAIDAALGLGAKDSTAIAIAEKQIMARSVQRQAEACQAADEIAADEQQPMQKRAAAVATKRAVEQNLGLQGQSKTIKAQRIQGLANDFSQQFQAKGASLNTAQAAGQALAAGKGAKDAQAIAQAHLETFHHQQLTALYQGVFEKHGVSPEVASAAGERMASGEGAIGKHSSPLVKAAYDQALSNLEKSHERSLRKPSSSPSPKSQQKAHRFTAEPLTPQQLWDKFNFYQQLENQPSLMPRQDEGIAYTALASGYSPQEVAAAIKAGSHKIKTDSSLSNADAYVQSVIESSINNLSSGHPWSPDSVPDQIWRLGNHLESEKQTEPPNTPERPKARDQAIVALSLQENYKPAAIVQAIARHSPYAKSSNNPQRYARRIVASQQAKDLQRATVNAAQRRCCTNSMS